MSSSIAPQKLIVSNYFGITNNLCEDQLAINWHFCVIGLARSNISYKKPNSIETPFDNFVGNEQK